MRVVAVVSLVALSGCSFHVTGLGDVPVPSPDLGVFVIDAGPPLDLAAPLDLTGVPPPPDMARPADMSGGYIHVTNAPTIASVDLTKEGTIDWAHWGYAFASDFDHKASPNLISNFSGIGALAGQYSDSMVSYKWNDGESGLGQHANSSGPTTTGVYVSGSNNGVRFTVPAGTTPGHARLYVGGYQATGKLQLTLSDGSAPAYSDDSYGSSTASFNVTYDVEYKAAKDNQTLQVTWTQVGSMFGANVTLQSATLLAP